MDYRLDEIDKRVIYRLMEDARNTSAPDIAEEVNVSSGTILNRIRQLEEYGVITGYHINVNFERVDKRLTNLFVCTAPVAERPNVTTKLTQIPGVTNVRELMAGKRNLHVVAVGTDMDDIARIARAISTFDVEIESENLLQQELTEPYAPFGPENGTGNRSLTDFISLAGSAQVVEITVDGSSSLAGLSLEEANDEGLLEDGVLIIAIERDGTMITPDGDTCIEADDVITLFSQEELSADLVDRFSQPSLTE
ncbi:winged helix-turn-helix transcriptional regulator [Halorarum halophilum]|uniref:Winged helix-turn-helix transcriptional regulator n=1 Tax=Halorarum halophilum TaxID=2743090 RepID=A0A7D5L2Y4_9EURY|nr:Lrp/AsnC family transcriptional regulator [Halobaculum halophilum]QLG29003.1 winged helix-turn-helix transcriptional regulator [Halobaculum halophilum]